MEILVIMAIFLLLLLIFFVVAYNALRDRNSLDANTQEIIKTLRLAQNKTLASEASSTYGVYFEANKFIGFKGKIYNPAQINNETHLLNKNVIISEINASASSTVVFDRLKGTTANSGFLKLELVNDPSRTRVISVAPSGSISLSGFISDDTSRVKDSRHVHVMYNQNSQIAITLSLSFPVEGVTQNIDYQANLDPGKTEFFWEGIITVNSVEQKLKIHSHALGPGATLFCIHRDRRYNSAALNISLDGENLINYSAAGVVTPGSSIWADPPNLQ